MRLLLLLISTLIGSAANAQSMRLSATVDKNRIMIGEPLQFEISATGTTLPSGLAVPDTLPFFEILDQRADTTLAAGTYTIRRMLRLTSWDSGRRTIPPVTCDGAAPTKPIAIAVVFSQPFDPKQAYHDEKDILNVEPAERSTWQWYLVLALVLLLIVLLLFPKRRKDAPVVVRPDVNYYKKVLQQLQQLQQDDARRGEPKQFYTELVAIFRQYIYKRKGYYSDADTSADLVARLHQWRMPEGLQADLRRSLGNADLAKFAKYRPGAEVMDEDVQLFKKAVIAIEENS